MARKAIPIGPNILALIEEARVDLTRAAQTVRKWVNPVSNCPTGHRSFKFRI
jgi:hypothetical protein